MIFTPAKLEGVYSIDVEPISDSRGWFARTFCKQEFEIIGHHKEWVQLNHSFTLKEGTIRGLHYQLPPSQEIKMVKCIAGAILDIVVDLRTGSPTFLKWTSLELSSANKRMIYIPEGFAHGFQTLTDNCELLYHHSAFYMSGSEAGINYDDPAVGIQWPLEVTEISERDLSHALINDSFKGI